MNRISKDLKKDAEKLLPDATLKERVKQNLFPSAEPAARPEKRMRLTFAMSAVACVLVIAIALTVIFAVPTDDSGYTMNAGTLSETIVLIDINPSFEIVADEKGYVKSVTGVNSDARIVLLGKDYNGDLLLTACIDIVYNSIKLGYVNNKHGQVNISAFNDNAEVERDYISKLSEGINELVTASGGTLVATDGEAAKQKLIDEIIAAYGSSSELSDKTVLELHRLLKQYDITKEKELDELEDLWEEELEKAGLDDDAMEDVIDKWKEENLKPLGEELEDELEYYIDIFEIKMIFEGKSEKEAEAAADEEEARLTDLGRNNRQALRAFIDEWWISAESEMSDIVTEKLKAEEKTEDEITAFSDAVSQALAKLDAEDRKELIAELIEGYYESLTEPDEDGDEYWEEFLEELFEDE